MKNKKKIIVLFIAFILLLLLMPLTANLIIDMQWFKEIGYSNVYMKKYIYIFIFTVLIGILIFLIEWIYISRIKKYFSLSFSFDKMNIFLLMNSFILSFLFSLYNWMDICSFIYGGFFKIKDPVFKNDVGFYIFKLPFLKKAFIGTVVILVLLIITTLILIVGKNFKNLFKGKFKYFKEAQRKYKFLTFAFKYILPCALFLIIIKYLFDSYGLLYSSDEMVMGAGFADISVSLIFYRVISLLIIFFAVYIYTPFYKKNIFKISLISCIIILLMFIEKPIYYFVKTYIVKPNEISFEKKYIENNILYTRLAYNINDIDEKNYEVNSLLNHNDIQSNEEVLKNIKINSQEPTLQFYNEVELLKHYYKFNDIDIDRYIINDELKEVFIAARQTNSDALENNTWQKKHLVYTHGYGIVMNDVNSVTYEGQPDFLIKGFEPYNKTDINLENLRTYFGENIKHYAIVNTNIKEFDYPNGSENMYYSYTGKSGIKMSILNRILFSIKEKDIEILLSNDINRESKIIINRDIIKRAKKIFPYIKYDNDPYVVIKDGRLFWVIDGYTFTNKYPYATYYDGINYIRNSVKVVVDAYNGDINFYVCDKNDPIINFYSKIYSGLFKDINTLSEDLKVHLKYPRYIFNIQSEMVKKYHVTDGEVFLTDGDAWDISKNNELVSNNSEYVITKFDDNPLEMILEEYFNQKGKENLVSMMYVKMNEADYGKLSLYYFKSEKNILYSPKLFTNKLKQNVEVSKDISLWSINNLEVIFGDVIIIPIGDTLLYTEPLYLVSNGENNIPELKRVVISQGDKIAMGNNLEEAIENLFSDGDQ